MSIDNHICQNCDHRYICKKVSAINKFSNDAKNPLGVDIRILQCLDHKEEEED